MTEPRPHEESVPSGESWVHIPDPSIALLNLEEVGPRASGNLVDGEAPTNAIVAETERAARRERFFQTFLATKPTRTDVRELLRKDSPLAELAAEVYFSSAVTQLELIEILDGVNGFIFEPSVVQRAITLLVDGARFSHGRVIFALLRHLQDMDDETRERFVQSIVDVVTSGHLNQNVLIGICRSTLSVCHQSHPQHTPTLLASVERTGQTNPEVKLLLLMYGHESQQKLAWTWLAQMNPSEYEWNDRMKRIILGCPSDVYVTASWDLLTSTRPDGLSVTLPDHAAPACIEGNYRATIIERSTSIAQLLWLYGPWVTLRPIIAEAVSARTSFSLLDANDRAACLSALRNYPELNDTLTHILRLGAPLSDFIEHSLWVSNTVEILKARYTTEPLTTAQITKLFTRFPAQRPALIDWIASLRDDAAGLLLQTRLLGAIPLTLPERAQLIHGLTANLISLPTSQINLSLLEELMTVPDCSNVALDKVLTLPQNNSLNYLLARLYATSDPTRQSRIMKRIYADPQLTAWTASYAAANPGAFGL